MNILFWNLHRNPITGYVKECLLENRVDVAVFAEHERLDRDALERETGYRYQFAGIGYPDSRIVMTACREVSVTVRGDCNHYSLFLIQHNEERFLFAGVHLQNRWNNKEAAVRIDTIRDLLLDLRNLEEEELCGNVIIIGDFNANPYDPELLQADAFNSALFKDVISEHEYRTFNEKSYRRLYNPILRFLSEEVPNYGLFYHNKDFSTPVWHCLDQILVSKSLMNDVQELRYLRTINGHGLLNRTKPNKEISDHLPLFVKLEGGRQL